MKRILVGVGAALMLTIGVFGAGARSSDAAPLPKADVCHHTSSETNPVVIIEISQNAVPHHLALHGGTGPDFVIDETQPGLTSADCLALDAPGTISGIAYDDSLNFDGKLTSGEVPVGGIDVTLTGSDYLGNPVSATATTGDDGSYSFNVLPGVYDIGYGGTGLYVPGTTTEAPSGAVTPTAGSITHISVYSANNVVVNLPEEPQD